MKHGLVEARAYKQNETFAAALQFARTEAIIPGPEPAHAIRAVIEEAEAAKQAGEAPVILLGLSGHGHFDMSAYESYLAGNLKDPEFSEADMDAALERLPDARRSPSSAPRGTTAAYPLLLALGALDATGYSVIVPVAPAIADSTGAGPATIGLLVASFPAGMVGGFALAGSLVRRVG